MGWRPEEARGYASGIRYCDPPNPDPRPGGARPSEDFAASRPPCWRGVAVLPEWMARGSFEKHDHSEHQLVAPVRGGPVFELSFEGRQNGRMVLGTADVSLVPAGDAHDGHWNEPLGLVAVFVAPELLSAAAETRGLARAPELRARMARDRFLRAALLTLADEAAADDCDPLYVESVVDALVHHLMQRWSVAPPAREVLRGSLPDAKLRRVKEFVDCHLDGPLSLQDLATSVELSAFHFARAFRRATGVTPHRWVTERRVARASELLLRSELPIAEVAYAVGLASQSHLTRVFARSRGETPAAYRRRGRVEDRASDGESQSG
jgi:AraC family transcriptional regulator